MKKLILCGVAVTLVAGVALASKRQVVIVGSPPTHGQQVIVADVDTESAFDTLWGNQADLIRFELPPSPLPQSACDDAEDCARAIKDACGIVDPTGPSSGVTVQYKGQEGTCGGSCNDGQSVTVICVSRR